MVYTTQSVKVGKTGIQIGYTDESGAVSTQNLNFDNKTLNLDNGITVSAGNASMAGDLAVSGGVNMGGIAHVEGATSLASTLSVDGAASFGSTLAVTGDANLSSALNVSGASHLVGALTQDGAASFGSTVDVSGATSLGSTLGVTGATHLSSTLLVDGASHLGSTLLVDGASHLVGALTQDGAASFGSTLGVTGATHLSSTLLTDGAATMGSTLDVNGASHLKSTLLVDGASNMGSTLTVAGASTFNNNHTVNGTSTVNGAMTVSGATTIGGALNTTGAATLSSTLGVTGNATFASNATVSGTTHLVGAVTADHAVSVGTTLDVTGASHLKSTLTVDGTSQLTGDVTMSGLVSIGNGLNVSSTSNMYGDANVSGDLQVIQAIRGLGNAHIYGTLTQDGAVSMGSTLNVTGDTHIQGALTQDGAVSMGSTLSVTGAVSMTSTLDVTDATHLLSTLLVDSDTHIVGALTQDGAATLGSTLDVSGATTMSSTLNVAGATTLANTLDVAENATFQKDVTVTGNLTVLGSQTVISSTTLEVADNSVLIAKGNTADTIESGMMIQYQPDGSNSALYAGLKRRPNTGEFVFFKDATEQIAGSNNASFSFPKGITLSVTFDDPLNPSNTELIGGRFGASQGDNSYTHFYIFASTTVNGTTVELVHIQDGNTTDVVLFNGRTRSSSGDYFKTYYIIFDKMSSDLNGLFLYQIQLYEKDGLYFEGLQFSDGYTTMPTAVDVTGCNLYTSIDTQNPLSVLDLFYSGINTTNRPYYCIAPTTQASSDGLIAWDPSGSFTGSYDSGLTFSPTFAVSALQGFAIGVTYSTAIHLSAFLMNAFDYSLACPFETAIYGAVEPTDTTVKLVHKQYYYTPAGDVPDGLVSVNRDSTNAYKKFYIVFNRIDALDSCAVSRIVFQQDGIAQIPTSVQFLNGLGPMYNYVFDGNGDLVSTDQAEPISLFTSFADYRFTNIDPTLYDANWPSNYIGPINSSILVNYGEESLLSGSSSGSGNQPAAADIYATVLADSFTCASDKRLKTDITDLTGALDNIDKIRGVTYNWRDSAKNIQKVQNKSDMDKLQIGVIAQEIQAVYPQLVHDGGNGFLSVDYPKLTAVLIQSVKELKAIVYELVAERNATKAAQ